MLTPDQRAQISRLRYRGYTDVKIANMLGVDLTDVLESRKGPGRPRSAKTPEEVHAHHLLTAAMKERPEDRYSAVKSVIGNFGPELGLTLKDTRRVMEQGA